MDAFASMEQLFMAMHEALIYLHMVNSNLMHGRWLNTEIQRMFISITCTLLKLHQQSEQHVLLKCVLMLYCPATKPKRDLQMNVQTCSQFRIILLITISQYNMP